MASGRRHGWRWRWRIAAIVGAMVVAVVLAHGIWLIVVQRHLTATIAALHAAGEPTTAAELCPPATVAEADNASVDYARAAALMAFTGDPSPTWKPVDEADDPAAFSPPLTGAERAVIRQLAAEDGPVLAAVTAGRGKAADAWPGAAGPTTVVSPDNLGSSRRTAELLSLVATEAAMAGDASAAVARLDDAVAMADAAQRRPTLVGHLVAVGMTAVAAVGVDRTMPLVTVTAAVRPAVAGLLGRLRDERAMRAGARLGWASDRLASVAMLGDIAAGRPVNLSGAAASVVPGRSSPLLYVLRPVIVADTAWVARYDVDVQHAAAAADWPTAERQLPTASFAAVEAHSIRHLAARMFSADPTTAVRTDYRGLAARRLAIVAVAARLFAADHGGRLPVAWPDLVPAYLPSVPVDPMDGRPLRIADGPPRAWSVGDDCHDDGGVPVNEGAPRSKRHGDDVAYLGVRPRTAGHP